MLTVPISEPNLNNENTSHKLRVHVLGRFLIEQGSRLVESEHWRSGKARSLFKILLARRGLQISRQEVAELLWPELDQERAANNLNQAVYSLRRTLEPELKHASSSIYVKTEGPKIQLNAGLIGWVDLEEFKQLYKQAQLTGDLELYEHAAALYGGDYLPEDLYEDWSVGRRETLRQEWSELLMQLALLYQARGIDEKYRQCLRRVLETDFSHEDSVQKLMRALNEAGRREEALTVYRNFAEKLQKRLGIEPLTDTRQLYKDISAGRLPVRVSTTGELRGGLAETLPPLRAEAKSFVVETLRTNLGRPASLVLPATPPDLEIAAEPGLIGRHKEQQSWQQFLQNKPGGLFLVAGPAGVGKSKLVEFFMKHATRKGLEIVYTICYPEFAEIGFAPLGQMIEQALDKLNDNEQEEFFKICPAVLATVLPNSTRLTNPTSGSLEPASQQIYFNALTQMLGWLGKKRHFLFVIENLHYLNAVTLKFLCYWLTQPVLSSLLCGTLRPLPNKPELQLLLERVATTQQTSLDLDDLPLVELEKLLTAYLRQSVGSELLRQVAAVTNGNPRLALDYTEMLRSKARLYLSGGRWEIIHNQPGQIIELKPTLSIQYMIDFLSPEALTLLKLGALAGKFFRFETIRQIVDSRRDGAGWWIELDTTRLGRAITEVLAHRLLLEEADGYRFAYPLLADGLVQSLPLNQRKCWREVVELAQRQIVSNQIAILNGGFDSHD